MSSTRTNNYYDDIDDDEIVLTRSNNNIESSEILEDDLNESNDIELEFAPSCSICYRKYNIINRIPTIITVCGHSVCSECIEKIDDCPICRKEIEETVINWAIHSELKSEGVGKIEPFYKIFVDFKKEIETDYLRYPDTPNDISFEDLSNSQKKLINKIKFRIKDIEIQDYMYDNLLIPKWITYHLKQAKSNIAGYKARLIYFGLDNLEDQLPFCPY